MQSILRCIDPHSTVNTHLDMELWWNEIHEDGASHIAELLNSTSIVSSLLLEHNPIGDKGLLAIFDALKPNQTINKLSLSGCNINDTGVASLADALHTNNTLQILHIHGNVAITENGLTWLVEAVSRHSGLKRLYFPKHFEVDKVRKTINEARSRNGLSDIDMW
jgi:hypothetical protein